MAMQTYKTVDEYITQFPQEQQAVLAKMRQTIQAAAPDATEKISYGIPTFVYKGNLVHFAAYDNHYAFYPGSFGIAEFKEELQPYSTSKGTIRFDVDKPVPYDLITKITKACVKNKQSK